MKKYFTGSSDKNTNPVPFDPLIEREREGMISGLHIFEILCFYSLDRYDREKIGTQGR